MSFGYFTNALFTGAQPKADTGHKMQSFLSFFQRYIVRDISLTWDIVGSLLLGVLAGSKFYPPFWKARGMEDSQQKGYSFLGDDTFPSLYEAQIYERKFKSEYLERQFYERLLKSEPSIEKLIENKSDLSKLSTLSEPSIVKFIANQSEHLSKLTLYHLKNVLQGYLDVLVNRAESHCYF